MPDPGGVSFVDAPLLEVIAHLRRRIAAADPEIWIRVADPDVGAGCWPGAVVERAGRRLRHRPLRTWVDLAERLQLRVRTPRRHDDGTIEIGFVPLEEPVPLTAVTDDPSERYGVGSRFAGLTKLEDPRFVLDVAEALERIELPERPRILDLGINRGDEIALLLGLRPELAAARFVGIDYSPSALAAARARFDGLDVEMIEADLGDPAALSLPRFDLVLSFGTLHSPAVDDRGVLRRVVQDWLSPTGAVIFGFPNCRYVDGELEYGGRVKNLREPELSHLLKDVAFFRRYLQQHRRRVFVTGKYEVLVTGVPIATPDGV